MEPFIGQIQAFGFDFAPRGWAKCDGQLLAISQYTSLFSLLGTHYGGDGRTTFGIPDLRGRVSVNQGQGGGLSNYKIGKTGGAERVTLTENQIANHSHTVNCTKALGNVSSPEGALPASERVAGDVWSDQAANAIMNSTMITAAGGGQAHANIQPYIVLNWCIALQGIFPSRN